MPNADTMMAGANAEYTTAALPSSIDAAVLCFALSMGSTHCLCISVCLAVGLL